MTYTERSHSFQSGLELWMRRNADEFKSEAESASVAGLDVTAEGPIDEVKTDLRGSLTET